MSRFLKETKENEIDTEWVVGIRKTWKKWASDAASYDGFVDSATTMDYTILANSADAATAYLEQGKLFIRRLREDLLLNKGFWTRPDPDDNEYKGMKGKAILLLRAAEDAIGDGLSTVSYWKHDTNPATGHHRVAVYKDQDSFNMFARTISGRVKDTIDTVDKIMSGKLLRHLTSLVNQSGKSGEPLDFGGYEPTILKIGAVTVSFEDTPVDPSRPGSHAGDHTKARHPLNRRDYVKAFKNVKALLDRRKLGFLWYGVLEVAASGTAPENPYGVHFGVGAEYMRGGDTVRVYAEPVGLEHLIAHELGHRYWFKYLKLADRERFSEWFGKVGATSGYGAQSTVEDFAEVFADYVMGKDLKRDQIDRLKAFLGGKREESLAVRMRALLG